MLVEKEVNRFYTRGESEEPTVHRRWNMHATYVIQICFQIKLNKPNRMKWLQFVADARGY